MNYWNHVWPNERTIEQPNRKPPAISQATHKGDNDGGRILSTISDEIDAIQNDVTVLLKEGICQIPKKTRKMDLARSLITFLREGCGFLFVENSAAPFVGKNRQK